MSRIITLVKQSRISHFLLVILLNFNFIVSAFADIDHTQMKGVNNLLRPEFQYLSPVEGFTLLKKGILENFYRYGNDEDQTVRLIRSLFHSVDGVNFNVTRLPSNVSTQLTSSSIGALLNQILTPKADLETRLSEVIYKEVELGEPAAGTSKYTKKERQILRKSAKLLAATLAGAIQESLGPESIAQQAKYPAHFPEQILLSFFWLKATNDRSEFLTLFQQIPQIFKDEKLSEISAPESWWRKSQYTLQEHSDELKILGRVGSLINKGVHLNSNPELSVFLAYSYAIWENLLPPIIDYERAQVESENQVPQDFADCGETSIRNFFNIVLKNPSAQKFDTSFIKIKAETKKLAINPGFLEFYETHSQLNDLSNQKIHNEWANVVSKLPKVLYKQPTETSSYCNLTGGLPSMLSLFGELLFLPAGETSDVSWESLKQEEKLNLIVEFFSRPGFQITWSTDNLSELRANDCQYPDIYFSINGKRSFTWAFHRGHFYINPRLTPEEDWRRSVGLPLVNAISASLPLGERRSQLGFLTWFLDRNNFKEAWARLGLDDSASQQFLLMSLSFRHGPTKVDVIDTILEKKWENLYPVAKKLISEIPATDLELRARLIHSLLKHGVEEFKTFLPT